MPYSALVFLVASTIGLLRATEAQDARVRVNGQLLDAGTLAPVAGAAIRIQGTTSQAITDRQGRFALTQVAPGTHKLEVEHVVYGTVAHSVTFETALTQLEIRLEARPIELPAIDVRVLTIEERTDRARGTSSNAISETELEQAVLRGSGLEQVIQQRLRALRTRDGTFSTGGNEPARRMLCVAASGRGLTSVRGQSRTGAPFCDMVPVYVDGIAISDAGVYLLNFPLTELSRVEWLSPIDARIRYGLTGQKGVLLLSTKSARRLDLQQ